MRAENIRCGDDVRWVGDPVDVVTGTLADVAGEFTVPGAPPIVWQRYYSTARLDLDGPLGRGQTHVFDRTLRAVVDGFLYTRPDGRSILFPYTTDRTTSRREDHRLVNLDGECHVHLPDGFVDVFARADTETCARPRRLVYGDAALELAYAGARLVRIADPGVERVVELEYVDGRVTALWLRRRERPLALMRYQYGPAGELTTAIDRYGHRQTFAYDAAHRMVARTDRNGYRFEYVYDAEGRCVVSRGHDGVEAVRLRYMPEAQATVVTRADGGEWLYRYDESQSITELIDPLGGVRRFAYDDDGRLASETDPAGNTRSPLYDATGELLGWRNAVGALRPADSPTGQPPHRVPQTPLELEVGDLSQQLLEGAPLASPGIDPLFCHGGSIFSELFPERAPRAEAMCRRDELGLLLEEKHPNAASRRWAYTPNGWVRHYTDHEGRRYEFEYASWNHRVAARDPLGRTIRYEYTPREQIAAVVDPAGNRHEYRYDLNGELTEVVHSGELVERYTNDPAGNLLAKHDARGRLLVGYEYGPDNLKSRRRLADGEEHRYTYTPDGQFARIEYGDHALEFAYTSDGRRCRDLRDGRGVAHVYSGERLTETTVLGRFTTRYRWLDPNTVELEDPLGNRHALVLEADGAVVRRFACGAREVAQYDSLGRCTGRHLFAADTSAPVWRRKFDYSPEGDLVATDDSERGRTEYRYDAAHQLAEVARADGVVDAYRYDDAANLIEAPHLRGTGVGTGNKLFAANGGYLEYDHRNNVASWERDGRKLTFHRDALDRLRRIDGLDAPWSAEYDPLGRRTRKTHGDTWTEYFWDTDRIAAELRHDGRLRVYVYADDFALLPWLLIDYDSPDADPATGRLHYLVSDQRGAPVAALDAEGRRVWSAELSPYGLARVDGDLDITLRLAGQFWDPETGLHYNRFRYYSPELGRYLEEDPAGTGGGLNLYAYTARPLIDTDPRGQVCNASKSDAKKLVEDSEGRRGPGTNEGHTGDHVALKGQDPKLLAESRPNKQNTTTYRSSEQAFKDLREILQANCIDINKLPPDGVTSVGGTHTLSPQRQGFNAQGGNPTSQPATRVVFNEVTWRICRLPNGELHLMHFSPHNPSHVGSF